MTRGPERSRKLSDVVREVAHLAAHGTTEVTLLGQTVNSYWDGEQVWRWEKDEPKPLMRSYCRPVSDIFQHLVEAGFVVERILEPQPAEDARRTGFPELRPEARDKLVPTTIIFKARRPA